MTTTSSIDREALKQAVCDEVDGRARQLVDVARQIHARPEVGHEEHFAHELLTAALEDAALQVERQAYGLETAFAGRAGRDGPLVAVLCEYDALPGLGHACGYTAVAAFRQHILPSERIHGIFTKAGWPVNVVPDHTTALWSVRSPTKAGLAALELRVLACLTAGALAAECRMEHVKLGEGDDVVTIRAIVRPTCTARKTARKRLVGLPRVGKHSLMALRSGGPDGPGRHADEGRSTGVPDAPRRSTESKAASSHHAGAEQVRQLQQRAGNHALAHALGGGPSPSMTLQRNGIWSSLFGGRKEPPSPNVQLRLRGGRTVTLAPAGGGYWLFVGYPDAYIFGNDQIIVDGKAGTATIPDEEYEGQILAYLAGKLTLYRGLPRHHPLWYEVRYMNIVMPLGQGRLPDWATNRTTFIPFGPTLGSGQGVAYGKAGMGPGDAQRMLADFPELRAAEGEVEVGSVVEVTIGPGVGIGFYNSGEIQVKGPITEFVRTEVTVPAKTLDALAGIDDQESYLLAHGSLRHARTVDAIAKAGGEAAGRLEIAGSKGARVEHARRLTEMRTTVIGITEGAIENVLKLVPVYRRPARRDDGNFRSYLDSSVNRVAHDAYVASLVRGDGDGAAAAGVLAARNWIFAWFADRPEVPFGAGWDEKFGAKGAGESVSKESASKEAQGKGGSKSGGAWVPTAAQQLALTARNKVEVPVVGDGSCLVHSILATSGGRVDAALGYRPNQQQFWNWLANQLNADLAHNGAHVFQPYIPLDQRQQVVADLRRGTWASLAGDLAPSVAAVALGLRLVIIEPGGTEVVLNAAGGTECVLIHFRAPAEHYHGTAAALVVAPVVAAEGL